MLERAEQRRMMAAQVEKSQVWAWVLNELEAEIAVLAHALESGMEDFDEYKNTVVRLRVLREVANLPERVQTENSMEADLV